MATKIDYQRPQVTSLQSEQILELLGPAQGYIGAAESPFSTISPRDGHASLNRR